MVRPRKLTEAQIKAAADRAEGKATDDSPQMGRPTDYNPAMDEQARQMYEAGATDVEVADFLGISTRSIHRWSHKHASFCLALKMGKLAADNRVERSLFHKATGYTFEAEEVFQYQGDVVRAKVTKHIPPDTTACIFWLKNRRPDEWREKVDVEHSGSVALGDRLGNSLKRLEEQPIVSVTEH